MAAAPAAPWRPTITITSSRRVAVERDGLGQAQRVTFVNNDTRPHDMESESASGAHRLPRDQQVGFLQAGQRGTTQNLEYACARAASTITISPTNTRCRAQFAFSKSTPDSQRTNGPGVAELFCSLSRLQFQHLNSLRLDERLQLAGRAGEQRKRAPVHRHDLPHAEQLTRLRGLQRDPS